MCIRVHNVRCRNAAVSQQLRFVSYRIHMYATRLRCLELPMGAIPSSEASWVKGRKVQTEAQCVVQYSPSELPIGNIANSFATMPNPGFLSNC